MLKNKSIEKIYVYFRKIIIVNKHCINCYLNVNIEEVIEAIEYIGDEL